ncbi:MAG: polyhydroxyalkanoate synthesis repressor PhaR [Rhodospirillaceae bacterium]
MARKGSETDQDGRETITIKKYANRRLYNTAESTYVTLDDLATMIQSGVEFTVFDAKSGEDITRSVLTQIIVEQEAKGNSLLPTGFLRQIISFYGDNLQGLVPQYLDMTMQSFARNQEQMRGYLNNALGGMNPFSAFEEMGRKNMAMFEQAISMITPFRPGAEDSGTDEPSAPRSPAGQDVASDKIDEMKAQLEAMQKQLNSLAGKKDDRGSAGDR